MGSSEMGCLKEKLHLCFDIVCAVWQYDIPPEQICVLQIDVLFGEKSDFFFPWGIKTVSACFFHSCISSEMISVC